MHRSATMAARDPVSKSMRHDLPKPKPPSLRPSNTTGRLTKSLEFNTEGSNGTGSFPVRQNRSVRTHHSEFLTNDLHDSSDRRIRSNTWTVAESTGPKREVTLFEFKKEGDASRGGRSYRIQSEAIVDVLRSETTERVKPLWDDTKSIYTHGR